MIYSSTLNAFSYRKYMQVLRKKNYSTFGCINDFNGKPWYGEQKTRNKKTNAMT